ncbi:hypothetical protein ACJV2T_01530 [Gardnerella sp. Marseille-Q9179]|uniref:hypothetical protein n=1 Tax=Gardnerella sp. Marseille-Q9179 TaxID=3383028 RepID=UPI003AF6D701
MLNKKAIAAFAAGATLLSGFAFAAPAMAEVTVPDTCPAEKPLKSDNAAVTAQAKKDWEAAKKLVPAQPVKPVAGENVDSSMYVADGAEGKLKMKDGVQVTADNAAKYVATKAFVEATNKYVTDLAEYNTKNAAAERLHNLYLRALEFENTCSTPDPDKKQEAIDNVRDAAKNLQNADNAFAKAKKAFYDAKAAFLKAQAELKAREAAWEAAKAAYDAFETSGVNDSAKEQRLVDAVNRAAAHLVRVTAAYNDAEAKYKDTKKAALEAKDVYNKALQDYKTAYNYAVSVGVNPALLPPVKTADPLDLSFNPVPGAKELYAEAVSGKFGPAVQAAAQKGKDSKASAQQNKKNNAADANGASASAAAKLPQSGAAVAMAAVAASVLAGMGAALRKIRH